MRKSWTRGKHVLRTAARGRYTTGSRCVRNNEGEVVQLDDNSVLVKRCDALVGTHVQLTRLEEQERTAGGSVGAMAYTITETSTTIALTVVPGLRSLQR